MSRLARYCFLAFGFMFVAIGSIGAVLPVLPTVPFMILALWCFSNSSERFHSWLYNHRIFGSQLQLWKKHRVIPISAKILAVSSMAISFVYISFFKETSVYILVFTALLMLYAIYYILSKPSYPQK